MWRFAPFLALVGLFVFSFTIQYGEASCTVNDDWPQAPCLDVVVNGCYDSEFVKQWMRYYDYKGASIMEEKRKELLLAIEEKRLKEWESISLENSNVWQYYYLKGEVPSLSGGFYKCVDNKSQNKISSNSVIPPPHKQLELGVKLGQIICDKGKIPTWNIHQKPACVFEGSEMTLMNRGWAKMRLILPGSHDPNHEMDITGQNIMSYLLAGSMIEGDKPLETLAEKRDRVWKYAQEHHPEKTFLEYSIQSSLYHVKVGEKIQFELLEWGNYYDCWDLKVRIFDVNNKTMYENSPSRYCLEPDGTPGTFHSYSFGVNNDIVCKEPGYYTIQVSNGEIYPPTILKNFACLEPESDSVSHIRIENKCSDNPTCYNTLEDGMSVQISCDDIPMHGCLKKFE